VWWEECRTGISVYVSRTVLREARRGDGEMARRRLAVATQLPILKETPESVALARSLLRESGLSRKAAIDALHLAVSAVHGMDYLLTWNCRHIANETLIPRFGAIIMSRGYQSPVICSPLQLLDGDL
jgi:hypothetical protein